MISSKSSSGLIVLAIGIYSFTITSQGLVAGEAKFKTIASKSTEIPFRFSGSVLGKSFDPWNLTPSISSGPSPSKPIPGWIDPVPEDYSRTSAVDDIIRMSTHELSAVKSENPSLIPIRHPKLPWLDLSHLKLSPALSKPVEEAKVLTPFIAAAFEIEGRAAVFKTTDEHLYYVVPNRWSIAMNGVTIDKPKDSSKLSRLRFLLSPSYEWTNDLTNKIKAEDPLAFFVPLPKRFKELKFEIPMVLGDVSNQLLPTDTMSIGEQIYMSVELDTEQIEILKLLNEANTYMTGTVTYEFPYDPKTNFLLNSDVWLDFVRI